MPGESPPNDRWRIATSSTGSLRNEQKEIHKGIAEEAIHHVARPVGRVLQNDLPQIPPVHVADEALRDEYCWEPDHENPDVQHPKEGFWCHPPSYDRSEMNPQADDESHRRKANEKPKEGSDPIRNRVDRREKVRNWGRRTILQHSRHISFEQRRTGGVAGIVVNNDRLILEVAHELVSFPFGWKVALVAP